MHFERSKLREKGSYFHRLRLIRSVKYRGEDLSWPDTQTAVRGILGVCAVSLIVLDETRVLGISDAEIVLT